MTLCNPEDCLILVVDDIKENLQLIAEVLEDVGYGTTFATNGIQALERLQNVKADLILLDLMMPEMNGLELCERIKSDKNLADIPVIFLTASDQQEHLIEAFEKGAVDYVNKPFKTAELLARVKNHLELKATQAKLKKLLEEQAVLMQELRKLATTDPLTGIWNRRHLFNLAERELEKIRRDSHSFSVLMLDIDHFKKINDTYGHKLGDEAIKFTAKIIYQNIRKIDMLGRYGGEEFVVFLPDTNLGIAHKVGERIRKNIEKSTIPRESINIKLTLSVGVASYNITDKTIENMLQKADQALYQAKHQGRNQVVSFL